MLILTRKNGQQIYLNQGKIKIQVIYQRRGTVALGILAPPSVDIERQEIFLKKIAKKAVKKALKAKTEPTVSTPDEA